MKEQMPDPLSPEKMQLFVGSLAGLSADEVRKAKVLYIRNALSELEAFESSMSAFKMLQGCFAIIPFFWPVLYAQKRMMAAQSKLNKDRIRNAIDVWKDDLQGERFQIDGEDEFR